MPAQLPRVTSAASASPRATAGVVSTVSSYSNPKAMYALSQQFTDVVTRAQVPAKLPRFDGRRMITTEPGQAVRDFIADLEYRGDHPEPDARIDNPLKTLNGGRNVALDPSLPPRQRPHLSHRGPQHRRGFGGIVWRERHVVATAAHEMREQVSRT